MLKEFKNHFRTIEGADVPKDPLNSEYKKILQFISAGGQYQPYDELADLKSAKISEIKQIRDSKNIEPIIDTQAKLIEENIVTNKSSYFIFHTNRHPTNPAADPSVILTNIIVMNLSLPYSTKDLEGNPIVVDLTPEIAKSIAAHLTLRNNDNYKLADIIIAEINKPEKTKKEIESITWNTNYL